MSKELSRSAVGQIVAQVDADRSPLAGRCGRQPGQRRGFELDDLGLVYLEHHGARRPRQPVAAGVESGRQDHRLTQPRRRGVEKEIVEEPRAHRNLFPHLLLGEGRIVPSDFTVQQSGKEFVADGPHERPGEPVVDQRLWSSRCERSPGRHERRGHPQAGGQIPTVPLVSRRAER
jgi:hypothetical protein